jgi:hypothetical protein
VNLDEVTKIVLSEFGDLNTAQLNWTPSPKNWSIGQCLLHLVISNGKYLPVLESVREGKHRPTFWERNNPMSRYTGMNMIKALGPEVVKKFKAPKLFLPPSTEISAEVIKQFVDQQKILTPLFEELKKPEYKEVIITSPVAGLITLPLQDALNIIAGHEMRHINQALEVRKTKGFPR